VHWGGVGYPGLAGQGEGVLRAARAAGAFVTCDLISPQPAAMDDLHALLPYVDLFMPSLAEVEVLTGGSDLAAAAARFMAMGAGACIFKTGRVGVVHIGPEGQRRVPAFAIDPVDTTTCGDSFCAGVHAARWRGLGLDEALRFASAVAARVAMGVGTLGALGSFEETRAFAGQTAVAA
jgi:sugar/nucleoside kinase (ribokinase family)